MAVLGTSSWLFIFCMQYVYKHVSIFVIRRDLVQTKRLNNKTLYDSTQK